MKSRLSERGYFECSVMKNKLIIVADDYGVREASLPILRLAKEGVVDRVAVLARFVSTEDARALSETGVALDIHLELIRLLGRGEHDGDSLILRLGNFLWHVLRGDLAPKRVEEEWKAQIEIFREKFGRLPDGMNSHEHVHFFPFFFSSFLRVAEEYTIGYIRFGSQGILGDIRVHPAKNILSVLHGLNRILWRAQLLPTSDYLVSADWIDDVRHFVRHLPDGQIEIVAHPKRPHEVKFLRALKKTGGRG